MELCNDHMIGPVLSHAADMYNHMFFFNVEIPVMEPVLVLFVRNFVHPKSMHLKNTLLINQLLIFVLILPLHSLYDQRRENKT